MYSQPPLRPCLRAGRLTSLASLCFVSCLAQAQFEAFAARDQAYEYGHILYRCVRHEGDEQWTERKELVFDGPGTYRELLLSSTRKRNGTIHEMDWTVEPSFGYAVWVRSPKSTEVQFFGADGPWRFEQDSVFGIQAHPCHDLGLGLSSLGNASVTMASPISAVVKGLSGIVFNVQLDESHAGEPLRMTFTKDGKEYGSWQYSDYRSVSPRLRLPFTIRCQVTPHAWWLYTLENVDLRKPSRGELQADWFKPGAQIEDYRQNLTASWDYRSLVEANGGRKALTPEALLALSVQQAKDDPSSDEQPAVSAAAGAPAPTETTAENAISDELSGLRDLPQDARAKETKNLALQIRGLPGTSGYKRDLALRLAGYSTEGDFGHDTLQAVADTLAQAVKESPPAPQNGQLPFEYTELAELARYEQISVSLSDSNYTAAAVALDKVEEERRNADFTLTDIEGHPWKLSALRGKVVLVNFWATWCTPCKREMPDLAALYGRFKQKGFVILAISNEKASKVRPFVAEEKYPFPVLLDPDSSVEAKYSVDGIPKSFVYNRDGRLVAEAMDMRTKAQLLEMLEKAGLK